MPIRRIRISVRVLLIPIIFLGIIDSLVLGREDLCGPESLYVALLSLNPDQAPRDFRTFRSQLPKPAKEGYSFASLKEIAIENGLQAELLWLSSDDLIRYIKHNLVVVRLSVEDGHHFVLCEAFDESYFRMFDSNLQRYLMDRKTLEQRWGGESMVLSFGVPRMDAPSWSRWTILWIVGLICLFFFVLHVVRKWRVNMIILFGLLSVIGCQKSQYTSMSVDRDAELSVLGASTINIGKIKDKAPLIARFRLQNDTEREIFIDSVRTSCSCAHATLSAKTIPPNEICEVELHVDSTGIIALEASAIVVSGNQTIPLKAVWQFSDSLRPNIQNFPTLDVNVGGNTTYSFEIEGDAAPSAIVESIIDPFNDVKTIKHSVRNESGICSLEIHVDESVDPGLYYGIVEVSTDLMMKIRIPWALRVIAPIDVTPKEVVFVMRDDSDTAIAQLFLEADNSEILLGSMFESIPNKLGLKLENDELLTENGRVVDLVVKKETLKEFEGVRLVTPCGYKRVLKVRW